MSLSITNRSAVSLLGLAIALSSAGAGHAQEVAAAPQLAALDASNPNLAEWTLINLNAADVASAKGGAGVKIALLDGVTDCRDTDLAGRCSYNLLSGGTYRYYSNHGTHTAGIAAGAKYGIATGATILNYAVFDDTTFVATGTKLANTWKSAYNAGARIASMSFGCTRMALCFSASEVSTMASSAMPMLYVKAAGNDGATLVNEPIAVTAATATAALNRLLLVGSVNATGTISTFSNRPGESCLLYSGSSSCAESMKWKYHFLVAPGEAIYSTLPGNTYGYMSGTSMATPAVAGAAALLQQRWPALRNSPETLARILLTTATDKGDPGVDAVYGYGLLNVAKAFQANGTITFASSGGTTTALTGSSTTSSSASFTRLASALGPVTVYDQFGRDFTLAETGALKVSPGFAALHLMPGRELLDGALEAWSGVFFADEPQARGFSLVGSAGDPSGGALNLDRGLRMGLDLPFEGGLAQLRLTGAGDPRQDFARDATMRPLAQFASTGMLRGAMIASVTTAMPGQARLMAYGIATSGEVNPRFGGSPLEMRLTEQGYAPRAALTRDGTEPRRTGIGMGYWKQPDANTVIGVNASVLSQSGAYYTLSSDLPFLRQSSRMFNLGAAGIRRQGPWQFSLAAEVTHLRTADRSVDGFAFSPATLVSAEIGLRKAHVAVGAGKGLGDSLALSLVVPPRAVAGSLRVDYLAPTEDGLDRRDVSLLVPLSAFGHQPARLETAYRIGVVGRWSFELTGGINLERADGIAPAEGMAAIKLAF